MERELAMTIIYPTTITSASLSPTSSQRILKGRGLKRRHLSVSQRAHLAADWITGTLSFRPSLEQAALVFGVPQPLLRTHLRACNGNGDGRSNGHRKLTRVDRLKADLKNATAPELAAVAHDVGVSVVWDRLIAPVLDEERAAATAAAK
jgi:hypothetical protein